MGYAEWTLASRRTVFHERYVRVVKDVLRFRDQETDFLYLADDFPGTAATLAVTGDGKILLVEQYRYPVGRYVLNLPGGILEPGESPVRGAARELREETGYTASTLVPLGSFFPLPGVHSRRAHVFFAAGLTPGEPQRERDEEIRVVTRSFREIIDDLATGTPDGEVVYAVFTAWIKGLLPGSPGNP
ncbi:NUDIX hydrolase [Desulforudis sp. 1088]|uniref:NUDIX hydrolase n=1 Tax=unclassified Candidatus Desulforudis TaxID=2635950 RepID=UPI003470ED7C